MSQPVWKLIAQLGDADPVSYGGYFIYEDTTGVYAPEAEYLMSPDSDDAPEGWTAYRFSLDRCTLTCSLTPPGPSDPDVDEGVLSDNPYHLQHPAWFAAPERGKRERPQDSTYLSGVARAMGIRVETLQTWLCSANINNRAEAYRAIGEYHGFENFDSDPLTFKTREEVEARYAESPAEPV